MIKRIGLPIFGFALAAAAWQIGVLLLQRTTTVAAAFAPVPTIQALFDLLQQPYIWWHVFLSLKRVGIGLLLSVLCGVPLGILMATWHPFAKTTSPLFQFLRMVSPLSWMPLAVMVFGIGDKPVYFLLSFSALWPVMLNTAAGVDSLDRNWLLLARSLSATKSEIITRIVLPGIASDVLTGIRLAIGIIWIVLVPAEMLGVSGGLGYFILDTRDRLAYSELMAAILIIGFLGFLLDYLVRTLHQRWLHLNNPVPEVV
jgi:NitT/TauT family transport system permease protein